MDTTKPVLDDEGKPLPVIEAPAVVVKAAPAGHQADLRAIVKDDARIEASKVIVAGQQATSNKWEYTQLGIALMFSVTTCIILGAKGLGLTDAEFPEVMGVLTGMIVQAYFLRTNSHKIGGVHEGKPETER